MITNQQIVDTYLAYKHMRLSGTARDDVRMMTPFYLMDASYQVYCKDIKNFECKHKVKEVKTRWNESYRKFFSDFLQPFDVDQTEFITDQMDDFEDYIHNKMVMLKTTVMGVFSPETSFEEKKILASVLTCNALSQMAQYIHRDMYRDKWHRPKDSSLIEAVTKNSYEFANHFPVSKGVDLTASDKVTSMISSLCKEVIKYLSAKFHETA